jgi:hypothetical protein
MAVTIVAFLAAILIVGCDKQQIVQTGPSYEVKRLDPTVWATTDSSQPKNLLRLNDVSWHFLEGERMVTTDNSGQAQLRGPNCSAVYVYQNSGLTLSGCPRGGGTGSCSTGTIVSASCNVSVSTMPADVRTVGTWFSVTYLEEAQVTLVIAGEGVVAVTPATVLDFRVVDRDQLQYEVFAREFGEEVQVEVVPGDSARVLYTASDDRLAELQELGLLPPPRDWLGVQELQPLRQVLSRLDPNLDLWLEQVEEQAAQGGIRLSAPPVGEAPPTLVTFVDGEARPNLAQSWEPSEDGMLWTFTLVQGREMSDGTPFTSEIVERVLKEEGFNRIKGYAGTEIVDDFTIVIVLEEFNPDLLREVAQIELPQ